MVSTVLPRTEAGNWSIKHEHSLDVPLYTNLRLALKLIHSYFTSVGWQCGLLSQSFMSDSISKIDIWLAALVRPYDGLSNTRRALSELSVSILNWTPSAEESK